jgi:hypothetical protein
MFTALSWQADGGTLRLYWDEDGARRLWQRSYGTVLPDPRDSSYGVVFDLIAPDWDGWSAVAFSCSLGEADSLVRACESRSADVYLIGRAAQTNLQRFPERQVAPMEVWVESPVSWDERANTDDHVPVLAIPIEVTIVMVRVSDGTGFAREIIWKK